MLFCCLWFSVADFLIVRCVLLFLYLLFFYSAISGFLLYTFSCAATPLFLYSANCCRLSDCKVCSASLLSVILLFCGFLWFSVAYVIILCVPILLYYAILLFVVFCCRLSDCKVCSAIPISTILLFCYQWFSVVHFLMCCYSAIPLFC